jgi:hypothetical protein
MKTAKMTRTCGKALGMVGSGQLWPELLRHLRRRRPRRNGCGCRRRLRRSAGAAHTTRIKVSMCRASEGGRERYACGGSLMRTFSTEVDRLKTGPKAGPMGSRTPPTSDMSEAGTPVWGHIMRGISCCGVSAERPDERALDAMSTLPERCGRDDRCCHSPPKAAPRRDGLACPCA